MCTDFRINTNISFQIFIPISGSPVALFLAHRLTQLIDSTPRSYLTGYRGLFGGTSMYSRADVAILACLYSLAKKANRRSGVLHGLQLLNLFLESAILVAKILAISLQNLAVHFRLL